MATLSRSDIVDRLAAVPHLQKYRNSTPVANIRGIPILVEDLALACCASGLNLAKLGTAGTGKSLLGLDIAATWFAGGAVKIPCHIDMKPKDVYEKLNLSHETNGRLKLTAHTLTGPSDAVGLHVIIADDLPRAPEAVQAMLQPMAEGYFEHKGVVYPLGDGYVLFLASGNHAGSDRGAFTVTTAMRQRLHVILDTDYFPPTTMDRVAHSMQSHEPRAYVHPLDRAALTKDMAQAIALLKPSLDMVMVRLFAEQGLAHCERDDTSKRSQKPAMPTMCTGCHHLAEGCGYTFPIEERMGDVLVRLTIALQLVAEAKAKRDTLSIGNRVDWRDALQAFALIAPHVEVFDERRVREQYRGNPYRAVGELTQQIAMLFERYTGNGLFQLAAGSLLSGSQQMGSALAPLFTGKMGFLGEMLRSGSDVFQNAQGDTVFGIPRDDLIGRATRLEKGRMLKVARRGNLRESEAVGLLGAVTETDEQVYILSWLGQHGSLTSMEAVGRFMQRRDTVDFLRDIAIGTAQRIMQREANSQLQNVYPLLQHQQPEVSGLALGFLLSRLEENPAIIHALVDLVTLNRLTVEQGSAVVGRLETICSGTQAALLRGDTTIAPAVVHAYRALDKVASSSTAAAQVKAAAGNAKSRLYSLGQIARGRDNGWDDMALRLAGIDAQEEPGA